MGDPAWQKWVLDEEKSVALIKKALALGINFFDTADSYSFGKAEEYLGNGLKAAGTPRDQVS